MGQHLVFNAGKGESAKLCSIEASTGQPQVRSLSIDLQDGESVSTPVAVRSRYGDTLALLFGQFKETPEKDRLFVVNLDPNNDGVFEDAKLSHTLGVGKNAMVGHSGHHAIAMLPDRRYIAITNPGDGSLWIVNLTDFEVVAKLDVEGTPTRLVTLP